MLGFLLVRSLGEALDDLAALVSVLSSPGPLRAGAPRAPRPRSRDPEPAAAALLAPGWVPYRHGLDFVGDVAAALTNQAADVAERRRAAAAERDPSSPRRPRRRARRGGRRGLRRHRLRRPLPHQPGRARRSPPSSWSALVGARTAFGQVSGRRAVAGARRRRRLVDARAPSPGTRSAFGTDVPAPPYVVAAGRCSATRRRHRPRRSACCWCSRCRSGCGAPSASCASSAAWSPRRARRAGCWSPAPRRTPWCR